MKYIKTNKYSLLLKIYKNKFIGLFLIMLIMSSIFISNPTKIQASGEKLEISEETQVSVKLNASGFISQSHIIFKVRNANLETPYYFISISAIINSDGTAAQQFSQLNPGGSYIGYIASENDPETVIVYKDFTTLLPPQQNVLISNFSPSSGKIGTEVTINGENFIGVSNVLFDTKLAFTKTVNPTKITVDVPTGATTGKITVGTTLYGYAISNTDFTVIPADFTGNGNSSNGTEETDTGVVTDCNTGPIDPDTGNYVNPCNFNALMKTVNKVINFVLFTLATPLFALIIIYVAWLYLSDMGSAENVKKAKKIFKNVVIGYVIALAAWLIVKTILTSLNFQAGEEAVFFDYLNK